MVANAFGILASRFRVLLGTMVQKPMVVRDFNMCCAQHSDSTPPCRFPFTSCPALLPACPAVK